MKKIKSSAYWWEKTSINGWVPPLVIVILLLLLGSNLFSQTNIAPIGTAYIWQNLATSSDNAGPIETIGINDKILSIDVVFSDASSVGYWQAAGIIWNTVQSEISSVMFYNGACPSLSDNGVFSQNIKLQHSLDGFLWTNTTDWVCIPAYPYTAEASNQVYTFNGPPLNNIRGVRIIGQVRTNDSWSVKAKEVQVISGADTEAPLSPSGLSVAELDISSFVLNWAASIDNVGVTEYEVFSNGISVGTTAAKTFSLTGLSPNTTYIMTVKARDASNNISVESTPLSVTTLQPDIISPTAPTELFSSDITHDSFLLSWAASTDNRAVTLYEVFKNGISAGTTSTTSMFFIDQEISTTYSMVVKAMDEANNVSEPSEPVDVITTAYTPPVNLSKIGINCPGISDYAPDKAFANAWLSSREVYKAGQWGNDDYFANIDTAKWPTEDFTCVLWSNSNMNGTYKLIFTGNPATNVALTVGTLSNKTVDGDKVTYKLVITNTGGFDQFITFTNTNGGARNIKVMRPLTPGSSESYPESTLYTDQIISFLSNFKVLRSMDMMGTNQPGGCPEQNWSDRAKPWWRTAKVSPGRTDNSPTLTSPWEYYVQLCNETNCDMWLCIPHMATDDYIRQLVFLIKNGENGFVGLNPNLKIYVEYSNELWNWAPYYSTQNRYAHDQALMQIQASNGNDILNYQGLPESEWSCTDGSCGFDWARHNYIGYKTVAISNIFRDVFGDESMMTRIRPIVSGQFWGGQTPSILNFIREAYGKVNQWNLTPHPVNYYVYGCGGSGYYGPDNASDNLTIDNIWINADNDINIFNNENEIEVNVATAHGLKRVCYEGGPGMDNEGHSEDVKEQAWNDQRMTQSIIDHQNAWDEYGGDLLMYFYGLQGGSSYYQWAFVRDLSELNTPKMKAINFINTHNRKNVTYGTIPPFSTDGNKWIKNSRDWENSPGAGSKHIQSGYSNVYWVAYLFRVTTAGEYSFNFDYTNATNTKVNIILDGGLPIGSQTISGTGTIPSYTLNVQPGLHSVMVEAISGELDINTVYFNIGAGQLTNISNAFLNNFSIYPNPARDQVNISLNSLIEGNCYVSITDTGGKEMLKSNKSLIYGLNNITVDLSNLNNGIYFIKVTHGRNKLVDKLIIVK